jgi:hypothetical protein
MSRRAAIVQRPMALVPSKSAQADLEPRHSVPKANTAAQSTEVS